MFRLEDILADEFTPTDHPVSVGGYVLGDVIGKGKSSNVRLGVRQQDQMTVAVKVIAKLASRRGQLLSSQYTQEVSALSRLRHEHIVTFHGCLQSKRNFYIFLELLQGMRLSKYVKGRGGLSEDETRHVAGQLVDALDYIHDCNIVLRDLKPDNIIINTSKMTVKLIDFGLSANLPADRLLTQPCGTPVYEAPEVTSGSGYGQAADIWSLGITIVEMILGSLPEIPIGLGKSSFMKLAQKREIFERLKSVSQDGLQLLSSLIEIDQQKRITAKTARLQVWFSKTVKDV